MEEKQLLKDYDDGLITHQELELENLFLKTEYQQLKKGPNSLGVVDKFDVLKEINNLLLTVYNQVGDDTKSKADCIDEVYQMLYSFRDKMIKA